VEKIIGDLLLVTGYQQAKDGDGVPNGFEGIIAISDAGDDPIERKMLYSGTTRRWYATVGEAGAAAKDEGEAHIKRLRPSRP